MLGWFIDCSNGLGRYFSATNSFALILECPDMVLMFKWSKLDLRRLIEFWVKRASDSIFEDFIESEMLNLAGFQVFFMRMGSRTNLKG